ncbi:MAG: hypothetical protein U9Q15_02940 [Patescibacteria group bacterium]|nr:hypothetical protein [Patescibacteria group bacterium]
MKEVNQTSQNAINFICGYEFSGSVKNKIFEQIRQKTGMYDIEKIEQEYLLVEEALKDFYIM